MEHRTEPPKIQTRCSCLLKKPSFKPGSICLIKLDSSPSSFSSSFCSSFGSWGAQSGVPMWVSVCVAIHRQMKVPSGLAFFAHVLFPSASRLDLGSKMFISIVVGQGRFRHPLLCPENNLGISPFTWDPLYNQVSCKP